MSRRRRRPPPAELRRTIRVYCQRGHPETQVVAITALADADARAAQARESRTTSGPHTIAVMGNAWSRAHEVYTPGEEPDPDWPQRQWKPRWVCKACGDDVTISPERATTLVEGLMQHGVSRIDLSGLRRILAEQ